MIESLDIGARHKSHGDIGIDLRPFSDVDIVGDGTDLPFKDNVFKAVYADQLLEHLRPPEVRRLLSEIHRVLEVGGRFKAWTPVGTHFLRDPTHVNEWRKGNLEWIAKDNEKIDYDYPGFSVKNMEYKLWWDSNSLPGRILSWLINTFDHHLQNDAVIEFPGVSGVLEFELEVIQ